MKRTLSNSSLINFNDFIEKSKQNALDGSIDLFSFSKTLDLFYDKQEPFRYVYEICKSTNLIVETISTVDIPDLIQYEDLLILRLLVYSFLFDRFDIYLHTIRYYNYKLPDLSPIGDRLVDGIDILFDMNRHINPSCLSNAYRDFQNYVSALGDGSSNTSELDKRDILALMLHFPTYEEYVDFNLKRSWNYQTSKVVEMNTLSKFIKKLKNLSKLY